MVFKTVWNLYVTAKSAKSQETQKKIKTMVMEKQRFNKWSFLISVVMKLKITNHIVNLNLISVRMAP